MAMQKTSAFVLAAALLGAGSFMMPSTVRADDVPGPTTPAWTPRGATKVLAASPVSIDSPFEFDWRLERPSVSGGWLLVLEVDPDLVFPQQTAEPVLFVGDQVAQRINVGWTSGRVVAFVPSAREEVTGQLKLDLLKAPIWFGTPRLPEQISQSMIEQERAAATAAGIRAFGAAEITRARSAGGAGEKHVADLDGLMIEAAALIDLYAADEMELAELLRRSARRETIGPVPAAP